MVAEEMARVLGERYQPGVKGGATLVIELTYNALDDGDGGTGTLTLPFGHDSGVDQLEGNVHLIGPRREAYASFPLLVSAGATYRSSLRMDPDPRRLRILANSFAYWAAGKLG
jgi:hypothetical protein